MLSCSEYKRLGEVEYELFFLPSERFANLSGDLGNHRFPQVDKKRSKETLVLRFLARGFLQKRLEKAKVAKLSS
jgi:hypothetical protein